MVGILKLVITKDVWSKTGNDWDECIGNILFFYRARRGRDNERPFSLMFGKSYRLINITAPSGEEEVVVAESLTDDMSRVRSTRVEQERGVGAARNDDEISEGAQVLLRNARKPKELESWWMGPFSVVERKLPRYGLRCTDGKKSR